MRAFCSFGMLRLVFEVDSMVRSVFLGFDANTRFCEALYENWFESALYRLQRPCGMLWNHY